MTAPSAIPHTPSQVTWLTALEWVRSHRHLVRWEAAAFSVYLAADDDDLFQEAVMAAFQALIAARENEPDRLPSYFRTIFRTHCRRMAVGIRPAPCFQEHLDWTAAREEDDKLPEPQPREIEAALEAITDRQREVCSWILAQARPVSTKETAIHFNLSQRQVCRIVRHTVNHLLQQRHMQPQAPSITEYARTSPIPRKTLLLLQRKELIQDPLTRENLIGLHLLEQVWGDRQVLRAQISRMSRSAREQFIRTVALHSKWERYAYSRYFNQEPGCRLSLVQVIEEIQTTFRFELSKQQISRIRNIRSKAQVAKYRAMKKMAGTISYIAPTKK